MHWQLIFTLAVLGGGFWAVAIGDAGRQRPLSRGFPLRQNLGRGHKTTLRTIAVKASVFPGLQIREGPQRNRRHARLQGDLAS